MIFNSSVFIGFFTIFFIFYWFVFKRNLRYQNIFLLLSSYFFYAYADWRLLFYLIVASLFNFYLGLLIERTNNDSKRRIYTRIGLVQGIGGLLYFKYFNFFIESFNDLFANLNISWNINTLKILVPIGLSFYTFKTISYVIDLSYGKISACEDWVVFFSYIGFFPTVLSGPIDRPNSFIPQLENKRVFNYSQAVDGLRQILWGLFKKMVIADNLGWLTDAIFGDFGNETGGQLIFGAFFYTMQLYMDFSGYSDMAIGFSRLLGFKVMKNFDYPFFAQNIAEYWRKWHISLTSWMTEYLFTPLSFVFRDYGKNGLLLAIIINFVIIGMWHGANWTFILYGLIHGIYFIPLIYTGKLQPKKSIASNLPSFNETKNMILTFFIVMMANIIFRAENIKMAIDIYGQIFSKTIFVLEDDIEFLWLFFILFCLIVEWIQKTKNHGLENLELRMPSKFLRWVLYMILISCIGYFGTNQERFIYFQF